MPKVLIACFDNWNTLAEVPFILKKAGFEVDVLCGKKAWAKANRFHDRWILAKPENEYVDHLIGLAQTDNYDWIIPGDEKIIKILNETITDESLFYKLLPLTKIENREVLSSKNGFSNVCKKYGIRTPGYFTCKTSQANTPFTEGLQYPLIIKIDFSWGGKDLKICQNNAEVNAALLEFPTGEDVIIQEFIKGKEVPVEALFWKGKLIAVACSEILAYDKDEFSYSTRRQYLPVDDALRAEIEQFGLDVGIHGFVNMAYMHSSANGLYYIIEADTRPSSWGAYIRHLGSSFAIALKNAYEGKPNLQQFKPLEMALFHKDIRRALYKHDVKGLLEWTYKVNYWKFIPWYDYKLMGRIISELWEEFIVDKIRRTFKPAQQ